MNRYPEVGEKVRILNDIGIDFIDDKEGEVIYRDGEYIMIKLDKSCVVVERYPCELESLELVH